MLNKLIQKLLGQKIQKHYVSPEDQLLRSIDQRIGESDSQKRERKRSEYIAQLRDNPNAGRKDNKLWDKF